MIGGSYGGQIQFATAAVDSRVDTLVPLITWNDLRYSLAPNNTSFTSGVTYANSTPGTEKIGWSGLFFGVGILDGLQGAAIDPARNVGCPNFVLEACAAKATLDTLGYPTSSTYQLDRPRVGGPLHRQGQGPDLPDPGRERHPVQPAGSHRHLPLAQGARRARDDGVAVLGSLRRDRREHRRGPRRARPDRPAHRGHLPRPAHQELVRPLPQAVSGLDRSRVLLLPRLGGLHGQRCTGVRQRRQLPGRVPQGALPLVRRPARVREVVDPAGLDLLVQPGTGRARVVHRDLRARGTGRPARRRHHALRHPRHVRRLDHSRAVEAAHHRRRPDPGRAVRVPGRGSHPGRSARAGSCRCSPSSTTSHPTAPRRWCTS